MTKAQSEAGIDLTGAQLADVLGQSNRDAWNAAAGETQRSLPWEALTPETRRRWIAAANAVLRASRDAIESDV